MFLGCGGKGGVVELGREEFASGDCSCGSTKKWICGMVHAFQKTGLT